MLDKYILIQYIRRKNKQNISWYKGYKITSTANNTQMYIDCVTNYYTPNSLIVLVSTQKPKALHSEQTSNLHYKQQYFQICDEKNWLPIKSFTRPFPESTPHQENLVPLQIDLTAYTALYSKQIKLHRRKVYS